MFDALFNVAGQIYYFEEINELIKAYYWISQLKEYALTATIRLPKSYI